MNFCDALQRAEGGTEVEHRREFDKRETCRGAEKCLKGADIRCAVLNEGDLTSCGIATGRIDEKQVGVEPFAQDCFGGTTTHVGCGQS